MSEIIILKHQLDIENPVIDVPYGSIITDCAVQYDELFVWVMSKKDDVDWTSKLRFKVIPTGEAFDPVGYTFVKTVHHLTRCGTHFVWHIFVEQS